MSHFDDYSGGNAETYDYNRRVDTVEPIYEDGESANEMSYDPAAEDDRTNAGASDLGESHISFLDANDRYDPNYLFGILQDALPKQTDAFTTEQQRRDQAEVVWERVRRWLWANPNPEQRQAAADVRGAGDATCLHLVCKLHNPPEDVVQALIESALDTVQWTEFARMVALASRLCQWGQP